MIQDLHSHTYYSFCGGDKPEAVAEAAINGGIEVLGFTDHNHGVAWGRIDVFFNNGNESIENNDGGRMYMRYFDHMNLIKEKYKDKIDIKRGIELCTLNKEGGHPRHALPDSSDISYFDYCLIENLDSKDSVTGGDLFAYAKRLGTPLVGIAHTNLFAHIAARGEDPKDYFKRMADNNIFWEMNISYDSIHNYHEHGYMLEFFKNEEQQKIVRESGARVSIGFDGHRIVDYLPERVKDYNNRLTEMGIKKPFEK